MNSQKLFYPIGEVAEMFNLPTSTIRFWEKEFDILKPKKNKKGNRLFTNEDIENLRVIYALVKENGYTLSGAKAHLKAVKKGDPETIELQKSLLNIRKKLEELREIL
ncbi:MAG: MerR family transcriptional regulator [Bacteroidales bacterium]|jgi:DNA-binding transcriptional MerR regulator|nr:MerR family transcriptional regulator [Bacteroidales bacterium]